MDLEVCDDVGALLPNLSIWKLKQNVRQQNPLTYNQKDFLLNYTLKPTTGYHWEEQIQQQQQKKKKQTHKKMTYTKQAGRGDVAPSRFHTKLVTEYTWYATFSNASQEFQSLGRRGVISEPGFWVVGGWFLGDSGVWGFGLLLLRMQCTKLNIIFSVTNSIE